MALDPSKLSLTSQAPAFVRVGPPRPASPLVIAVPHAGRDYPPALLAASRLPRLSLESIEDRHVDALFGEAVRAGAVAIVAQRARAWIDLNRDPREIDSAMIDSPLGEATLVTAKLRGGLGLIPRRIAEGGEIWRRRLSAEELAERVADHAPYHAAIDGALSAAQAMFGVAVLIDLHSMPTLPRERSGAPPTLVLGDRHGVSCGADVIAQAAEAASAAGAVVTRNRPYAGGYTLDRHGAPARGRHALQIEIDRALYLEADRRTQSARVTRAAALIARVATAAVEAALDAHPIAQAAE